MIRELILHIVSRVKDEGGTLGITKLVKILYILDVEYYRRHRGFLTGLNWVFYRYGPYAFEIPDILRGLDLELPQEDVPIGGDRYLHKFKPEYLPELDIESILSPVDAQWINKQISKWALEDLNKLLSFVYFDTEPMYNAELGKPLDFSKIPRLKSLRYLPESKLKLTSKEIAYFASKLAEQKIRRSELISLAEKQYPQVHRIIDPVYEKAIKRSQEIEENILPIGMRVMTVIGRGSSVSEEEERE